MPYFEKSISTTPSDAFSLGSALSFCGGLILTLFAFASTAHAQISGATKRQPVIATGASSATSKPLYLDATQFASIQAAIGSTSCPTTGGCTVDARALPSSSVGDIDPGRKSVTILFGPQTYGIGQITIRPSLRIFGVGSGSGVTSTQQATILQALDANITPFVMASGPVPGVDLEGFAVYGFGGSAPGVNANRTPAFNLTASGRSGGCFWCIFRDIGVLNFDGSNPTQKVPTGVFTFVGSPAGGGTLTNQFIIMENVRNYRNSGKSYGLYVAGQNGQMYFTDCEFDGQGPADPGTNIYIGVVAPGSGNNNVPYSLSFRGLTSQGAAVAVNINGATNIRFEHSRHEALAKGAYNITNPANPGDVWSSGIVIDSSFFAANVGVPNGYDVNIATTAADLIFSHNLINGQPGHVIAGTQLNTVTYTDNSYNPASNVSPVTSGITPGFVPANTVNVGRYHVVMMQPGSTPIQNIVSQLGPGETVTFTSNVGSVGQTFEFATGGNLSIGSNASPLLVKSPDAVTFIRSDLSQTWYLIGKSF
jgi:hypothetical protein